MVKRRDLEPKVRELRSQGKTYLEIEGLLGINEKTVRRWLQGAPVPVPEMPLDAPEGAIEGLEREWPKEWTIDTLEDLPGFNRDRDRWEVSLVIIEVAQRQGNTLVPWYFKRIVETSRRCPKTLPPKALPWIDAIAGLPVLAEWLGTPECVDLADLIEQHKPWEGKRQEREYRRLAQPYVRAIEHGIVGALLVSNTSVDTLHPLSLLLSLLAKWVPNFDHAPLLARVARMDIGHFFIHLFRNPKPMYGGMK